MASRAFIINFACRSLISCLRITPLIRPVSKVTTMVAANITAMMLAAVNLVPEGGDQAFEAGY